MILGSVLVAAALALFLYNQWDANRAGDAAAQVQAQLIDELEASDSEPSDLPFYFDPDQEMTVVTIDGYDYIGYVSIPSLNLTLPVMSEWSYPGLKIAPGRFSGSVFQDNLVIAGHNYSKHFGPVKWLETGTEVDFIDMDNHVWQYEMIEVETLQPTQVEEMTTASDTDDWDLTLFTCNTGGQTRCAVRCVRVQ